MATKDAPECITDTTATTKAPSWPCLHCSNPNMLKAAATHEGFCCFRLPFCSGSGKESNKEQLLCQNCGFATDQESYKTFQAAYRGAGLAAKSFDNTEATDVISYGSGTPKSTTSNSEEDPSTLSSVDEVPGEGRSPYGSLDGLVVAESTKELCQACDTYLEPSWRFCPTCGVFAEASTSRITVRPRSKQSNITWCTSPLVSKEMAEELSPPEVSEKEFDHLLEELE